MARRASGQAMVELVVVSGICCLLFLGIWYLGKFHDLQATTIQAARYAAWERTAQSSAQLSDAQLGNQLRARLFSWNRDAYKNTDSKAANDSWGTQSAVWRDHAGTARLIARPRDVQLGMTAGGLPGKAAAAVSGAAGTLGPALGALTGGESLPAGGVNTSTVSVAVANVASLPAPWNKFNLNLKESASVVTEQWDAADPRQAAERSRSYVASGRLDDIRGVIGALTAVVSVIEPDMRELALGRICPDIVPADRLRQPRNLAVYNGAGPCY